MSHLEVVDESNLFEFGACCESNSSTSKHKIAQLYQVCILTYEARYVVFVGAESTDKVFFEINKFVNVLQTKANLLVVLLFVILANLLPQKGSKFVFFRLFVNNENLWGQFDIILKQIINELSFIVRTIFF